jgi:hypothetical protein
MKKKWLEIKNLKENFIFILLKILGFGSLFVQSNLRDVFKDYIFMALVCLAEGLFKGIGVRVEGK